MMLSVSVTAEARTDNACDSESFPRRHEGFGIAKIFGVSRAYLRSDTAPCPNDNTECRTNGYVIAGDTVITGGSNGAYICVFFNSKRGGSAGYVKSSEILPQSAPPLPPISRWTGTWHNGDNTIDLRPRGDDMIVASGDAYWWPANRSGGPNYGEMGGAAIVRGNTVTFSANGDDSCRVTATLVPPFLVVADNLLCGGQNVSFTGVYRR
jgi:hypothetical protein